MANNLVGYQNGPFPNGGRFVDDALTYQAGQDPLNREHATQLANIGQTGARLQQQRFNKVFPWMQQQMGSLLGQFNSSVGGASTGQPHISAGPVINPQMQQQQINAMRARAGMQAATQDRIMGRQAAGRGLGANSPLAMALRGQNQAASRAGMADQERELKLGNATANASHMLQAQQAREGQFSNRMGEDIERRRTTAGMFPALLSAFGGLV